MSANNVKPSGAILGPATIDGAEDDDAITIPVDADGMVRVWLRANVLGGRAGTFHNVRADHPELPVLLAQRLRDGAPAVQVPDPVTGQLQSPPRPRRPGCGSCR